MYKWELCGRTEWADTREQAAVLLGATDPNEVRFAGYCEPVKRGLAAWMPRMRNGSFIFSDGTEWRFNLARA